MVHFSLNQTKNSMEVSAVDKCKLMREISAISFAAWELHLYLDSHPYCTEAAKKFAEYRELSKKLLTEYGDKYGPLNETARDTSRWAWISDPWPWEAEANE